MRPRSTDLKVRQGKDSFTISYDAVCQDADQGIRYAAKIEATAEGTLKFSAPCGTPLTDFLTNRTGFVVLHPLVGVVGEPVEIVHTDGKTKKSRFPKFISPGQPVFEIRSLKHTVTPGVTATVLMEGNKFEMEDHRNWMDASYKTYVCSLLDPWPYTLKKGEAFTQSITVTIAGKARREEVRSTAGGVIVDDRQAPRAGSRPSASAFRWRRRRHALDQRRSHRCRWIRRTSSARSTGARMARRKPQRPSRALRARTGQPVTLEIVLPAKAPADEEVAAIAAAAAHGGLQARRRRGHADA